MAQQTSARLAEPTPFSTDPSDELPVGLQLTWRLRALIATGGLASGERLPSFRRLAELAGVNVNTVRAVYEGLEGEGLVVSRQGQGTFVAEGIEPAPELEQLAAEALRRAQEAGLDPRDLAIVAMACASIPGVLGEPAAVERAQARLDQGEAIEVRQELRRQIGRLEAELGLLRTRPAERPADGATQGRGPCGRGGGVGADAGHADRAALGGAEGGGGARPAGRRGAHPAHRVARPARGAGAGAAGRRTAAEGDELVAGEAVVRALLLVKPAFEQVGEMVILTAKTIVSAVRSPYPYGEELVGQFLFVLKLSWFPLTISTFALNLGAPGLQAAGVLSLFGALDRLGGFFIVTAVRWIGPLVTAVVVAGVAGTAITADLGARKIREELDALQVLGVDPIKNLVVPRFLALMIVTSLLDIFAIVFGLSAGIAAELLYHQSLGGFFATLFTNATVTDIWASVLMCTMFGAIIAVVCSYKGMSASGGAEGVGRAVNQAVVIALVSVFFFQFVVTSILLATNPDLQSIR